MSYAALEIEVVRWAEARGIVKNSNPLAQARKTLEECGELIEAASLMTSNHCWQDRPATPDYRDAIGDILVTLIVGAACADVDVVSCLEQAYNEIKDRKGYLRPDGVFVKQQ